MITVLNGGLLVVIRGITTPESLVLLKLTQICLLLLDLNILHLSASYSH